MKRNSWKDYFIFSRKERNAVVILLIFMATFIALPFLFSAKEKTVAPDEKLQQQIALLQNDSSKSPDNINENTSGENITQSSINNYQTSIVKDSLFYFDPNTIDENGWKLLGVKDKTIGTILNYRNKGGKFYKPEDLEKIYGLNKEKAAELIPFVQIKNGHQNFQQKIFAKKDSAVVVSKAFIRKTFSNININTATVDDWKSLPGIGDVLGNRIVKFRNAIGGFKSIDDVKKTYGLSDSVFQIIQPYLSL